MRVALTRDGRAATVEVAADLSSATIDGRTYPVRVVHQTATRVELEVAGETVVVEGWYERFDRPTGPVDVNGERWKVGVERSSGGEPTRAPIRAAAVPPPAPATRASASDGTVVLPPMPGKVVELRVSEGQPVRKGDVLLVLEAMKMRNEIVAPTDGVVRAVRVAVGSNVRAKEPMLEVARA